MKNNSANSKEKIYFDLNIEKVFTIMIIELMKNIMSRSDFEQISNRSSPSGKISISTPNQILFLEVK